MIFDKLKELISEQMGIEASGITMESNFEEDLGVDSLDIVEMSEEDLATIKTVGDLVGYLQKQLDM